MYGRGVTTEQARPASIRDVAARAGVSRQTVSRVLNGQPGQASATEARVRRVMEELDYRPNRAARILASSRHRTIGIITTAATMFGPASIVQAIERAARARGYAITSVSAITASEDEIAAALVELVRHGIDGLIVVAPQARSWPLIQRRVGRLPSLTLQWQGGPAHTVSLDQHAGAVLAVRHLTDLGHTRVLHVAGPEGWAEVQQRIDGYRDAVAGRGLEPLPVVHGDWTADSGYELGRAVLRATTATAAFVSNDQMAIGLLHAAHELGVRVPDDLSVVGFDDIPEARHAIPPLTTVRQEFEALGDAAITRIVAMIEGGPAVEAELADQTTLVVRESTARVR